MWLVSTCLFGSGTAAFSCGPSHLHYVGPSRARESPLCDLRLHSALTLAPQSAPELYPRLLLWPLQGRCLPHPASWCRGLLPIADTWAGAATTSVCGAPTEKPDMISALARENNAVSCSDPAPTGCAEIVEGGVDIFLQGGHFWCQEKHM